METAQKHVDAELTLPMTEVLVALGQELEHVRSLGMRVEAAFCAHAVQSGLDSSVVQNMQQLDAVLQHLAALRDFVSTLSHRAAGPVAVIDALDRVFLADVRVRLSGGRQLQPEGETEVWSL